MPPENIFSCPQVTLWAPPSPEVLGDLLLHLLVGAPTGDRPYLELTAKELTYDESGVVLYLEVEELPMLERVGLLRTLLQTYREQYPVVVSIFDPEEVGQTALQLPQGFMLSSYEYEVTPLNVHEARHNQTLYHKLRVTLLDPDTYAQRERAYQLLEQRAGGPETPVVS